MLPGGSCVTCHGLGRVSCRYNVDLCGTCVWQPARIDPSAAVEPGVCVCVGDTTAALQQRRTRILAKARGIDVFTSLNFTINRAR